MRSWRRGTKEMDLILGPFADAHLAGARAAAELDLYDALLAENDQDLMAWMLGQSPPPARFAPLIARIAAFARDPADQRGNLSRIRRRVYGMFALCADSPLPNVTGRRHGMSASKPRCWTDRRKALPALLS